MKSIPYRARLLPASRAEEWQRYDAALDEKRGHEGFRAFITGWIEPFEEFNLTAEEFLDAGDRVVVQTSNVPEAKKVECPVEGQLWLVHHMRDSKVIELDLYDDKAAALAAAELSE